MPEFKAGVLVANSQQISWKPSAVLNDKTPQPFKGSFGVSPGDCSKARLLRGGDRRANGSLAKVSEAPANYPVISLFQSDIVQASAAYVRQAQENFPIMKP